MTRIIRQYLAEFGPLNLFADALAIVSVFALIGMAFAFPTAATTAPIHSPAFVDAAAWGEQP